jgi:cellulose biosynthesis protein BcsQ
MAAPRADATSSTSAETPTDAVAPSTRSVAVLNQKGGVGKTTVTLGLASAAMSMGRRVLVVDLDPQASSTWVLGHDGDGRSVADVFRGTPLERVIVPSTWSELVDVVPGATPNGGQTERSIERRGATRLRNALAALPEDRYDAILLDCPPTLGGSTRSALIAARHALIVVDPSALGLRGIGGVADAVDDVWQGDNPDLDLCGVVVNRVPAISSEAERRLDELARIVGRSTIWKPPLPQRVIVNQALGERRPIHAYGARASEISHAFDALWTKLRRVLRAG